MIKILNYVLKEGTCIPVEAMEEAELRQLGEQLQHVMMEASGFLPAGNNTKTNGVQRTLQPERNMAATEKEVSGKQP